MPEPTPQKTHNSLLKNTREAKGLTLDIVHEATKIPMDALKAIEEGYSVRILTPFYYRGFLKIYAEFLGLDPADVLAHYEVQKPKSALPVSKPIVAAKGGFGPKPTPARPAQPKVNNEAMEAAGEFFKQVFSPKNRAMMARVAGIALAIFVVLKIGGCAVNAFKKHASARPKVSAAKKIQKEKPVVAAVPVEAVEETPAAPTVIKSQSDNAGVTLAVRVPKDTWIRVKTDGKTVFQARMKKGTSENWEARDQIELSGKNINELDLEVNGKHIGALGGSERGAKRVLINKEGLTVKK